MDTDERRFSRRFIEPESIFPRITKMTDSTQSNNEVQSSWLQSRRLSDLLASVVFTGVAIAYSNHRARHKGSPAPRRQ